MGMDEEHVPSRESCQNFWDRSGNPEKKNPKWVWLWFVSKFKEGEKFLCLSKTAKNGLNKRGNSLLDTGSPSLCPRHTHQRLVSDQRYTTPVLSSPGSSPHKHTHTCQCVGRTQLTQRGPPPKSTLTSSTGHTQAPARLCTTPFKRFLAKNQRFAKTVRPKCFPGSL